MYGLKKLGEVLRTLVHGHVLGKKKRKTVCDIKFNFEFDIKDNRKLNHWELLSRIVP